MEKTGQEVIQEQRRMAVMVTAMLEVSTDHEGLLMETKMAHPEMEPSVELHVPSKGPRDDPGRSER